MVRLVSNVPNRASVIEGLDEVSQQSRQGICELLPLVCVESVEQCVLVCQYGCDEFVGGVVASSGQLDIDRP